VGVSSCFFSSAMRASVLRISASISGVGAGMVGVSSGRSASADWLKKAKNW
jgi:hypothetical protein